MSWLDTHKDAKKIETIEELKPYLNKQIYYKKKNIMIVVERIRDNSFIYHDVCDLWNIDAAEFDECSFYVPYKNEKELKKEKMEEDLKANYNEKGVTKVITEYFGATYEVPKEG